MSRRRLAAATLLILARLTAILPEHGFTAEWQGKVIDRHRFSRWDRNRGWAIDRVEISHEDGFAERLAPKVVAVLCLDSERELLMDVAMTYYLAGRPLIGEFPLGTALMQRSPVRLAMTVANEIGEALQWFTRFATPSSCLAQLASPTRNGVPLETAQMREAVRILEARIACGLNT